MVRGRLTIFGRWVYYISSGLIFQGKFNGGCQVRGRLTFFGRWVYYISSGFISQGEFNSGC